eukprot:g21907.t1
MQRRKQFGTFTPALESLECRTLLSAVGGTSVTLAPNSGSAMNGTNTDAVFETGADVVIDWSAATNASEYDVLVYSVTAGKEMVNTADLQATTFTPAALTSPDRYQVFVRGGDAADEGAWSSPVYFTLTGSQNPQTPVPPATPTFTGLNADTPPALTWTATNNAVAYDLLVYNVAAGQQVLNQTGITDTQFAPTALLSSGDEFQAFVRATDGSGTPGNWSTPFNFHGTGASQIPAAPVFTGVTNFTPPEIQWVDSGADSYELLIYSISTDPGTDPGNNEEEGGEGDYKKALSEALKKYSGEDKEGRDGPWSAIGLDLAVLYYEELYGLNTHNSFAPQDHTFSIEDDAVLINVTFTDNGYTSEDLTTELTNLGAIIQTEAGSTATALLPIFSLDNLATAEWLVEAEPIYVIAQEDDWIIGLAPGTNPATIGQQLGVGTLTPTGIIPDTYTFKMPDLSNLASIYAAMESHSKVEFFEPNVATEKSTRLIPNDPLFGDQWHLFNSGQGPLLGQGVDINVIDAWDNHQGTGVVIGVIDTGFDWLHPDLLPNFNLALSWDYFAGDFDPYLDFNFEDHGTAVAGLSAARGGNNIGVAGSAFGAQWAGLRLLGGDFNPIQEAGALHHRIQDIDVYNNSWGPIDDGIYHQIGRLTKATITDGVTSGRGGLGNIYVWAAGNGLGDNDNVNYDGWASNRHTIAVGAIGFYGDQTDYSEPGASMLVTAPGGWPGENDDEPNIWTTDVFGNLGYNGLPDLEYTNDFNGTSAASPIVAGVVALMLDANPNLTWRDVQHILVNTAAKNDPADFGWYTNGAGRQVNHKFGHGLVDATAAVNMAATWTNVAPEVHGGTGVITTNQFIPDFDQMIGVQYVTDVATVYHDITIESVEITVDIDHSYRGDLRISLISPSGSFSQLAEPRMEDAGDDLKSYVFTSVMHWGENSAGDWTIVISDEEDDEIGIFNSWSLDFYGTGQQAPDFPPGWGVDIPETA